MQTTLKFLDKIILTANGESFLVKSPDLLGFWASVLRQNTIEPVYHPVTGGIAGYAYTYKGNRFFVMPLYKEYRMTTNHARS